MASEPDRQAASQLNRELTQLLLSVGKRRGFEVVPEYPVKGGRLDVVWAWSPPTAIPGLDNAVPVVGFESLTTYAPGGSPAGILIDIFPDF